MSQSRARIKPGRASLIGGIAVAFASFVIWTAIARELGAASVPILILGFCVSLGVGAWIRLADL